MSVRRKFACVLLVTGAFAQRPAPLPPNYKVILDNESVLVQRVHYGPHELVPLHDHPAVATVYVYLNHSGVVDIAHRPKQVLFVSAQACLNVILSRIRATCLRTFFESN